MKIRSVDAYWVHIPIPSEKQHTSDFGRTTSFDATLVRIDTECGLTGWGEAKAQVGSMAASQALTVMINEEFAPLLIGEDPRDITRLWETLYNGSRAHYALREGRVFPVLGRRGITLTAGLLTVLGNSGAACTVPPRLIQATLQAATGRVPAATVTGVRLTRRSMRFDPRASLAALGLEPQPVTSSLTEAVEWFREVGWVK